MKKSQKKVITLILILCVCLAVALTACNKKVVYEYRWIDLSEGVEFAEYQEMEFTVCSYNIKGGEATMQSVTKIKDNIESVGADLAGLQEVDHLSNRTGKADFLSIFQNQSKLKYVKYVSTDLPAFGGTYGLAQVSTKSLYQTKKFNLPYPYENQTPKVENRIVIRSLVKINGVQVAFYNTHLSYEEETMKYGETLRSVQMDYLLLLLQSDPCPYKVVTGDFNVLSFDEYFRFKQMGYDIVNNAANKFDTYRGNDASFNAIDNIIYSSKLQLVSSDMLEDNCSDHNMLYAKFKTIE